jgi:hypothetical protein
MSATGRKPFLNVMYLEKFVPKFVSVTMINSRVVVLVGGSGSIMFGYCINPYQLLFSLQLEGDEQHSIENILYN